METYLSVEGLAKYLDVAVKTVRKWVLNRDVPFRKVMGVVRFRLSEVENWINTNNKHRANDAGGLQGLLFADDGAGYEPDGGDGDTGIEAAEAGGIA